MSRHALVVESFADALRSMEIEGDAGWKAGYTEPPEREPSLFPCWYMEEGEEAPAESAHPLYDWTLPIDVYARGRASSGTDGSRNEVAAAMLDDIVRAVMADTTRGGAAWDTEVSGRQRIPVVPPEVVVVVRFRVKYRTTLTDPRAHP